MLKIEWPQLSKHEETEFHRPQDMTKGINKKELDQELKNPYADISKHEETEFHDRSGMKPSIVDKYLE